MVNYEKFEDFTSTNIKTLWYSASQQNLIVQYVNGQQYRYDGVTMDEWNQLKGSQSKGKFINQSIKSKPYQRTMLHD